VTWYGDAVIKRRSILQVTLWNSPYLGNFMSSELAFAGAARDRLGLGTHFVLGDGAQGQPWLVDLEAAGATWSILPSRRSAWRSHLAATAGELDVALVHTHFSAADLAGAAVASSVGAPCIWHLRTGFNRYSLRQRLKDIVKMRIVSRRRVDRIIAVAPWLADLARRRGMPQDRIRVLPSPITIDRFTNLPSRDEARKRFGLDPHATVLLALGWWPEVKGVDVLIDAVEPLARRYPTMQALLVGEEPMRSFLASRLPSQPPWLRLSGFVNDSAWLFAAADIFVSASRHEGQPAAIGEAIACGLPVVMSDIAGSASWAAAPHVSTFPSEEPASLCARLDALLAEDTRTRDGAGLENRRWAENHLGTGPWCDALCAIYSEVLA
jgi:glycosyltransferase involved in cell wall biosynthesis